MCADLGWTLMELHPVERKGMQPDMKRSGIIQRFIVRGTGACSTIELGRAVLCSHFGAPGPRGLVSAPCWCDENFRCACGPNFFASAECPAILVSERACSSAVRAGDS